LGLVDSKPTVQQLRHAYFEAAKLCHPDVKQDDHKLDFRELTEAYDHLMNGGHISHDQYEDIPRDEEDEYRSACMEILGIRAEIVEESKQNPMFLRWLSGNTDGAQYWRNFFSANGGLSQKLRPLDGYLTSNGNTTRNASESRRRRRR
jgi:curved DNA-binding protein CbpA